VGPPVPGRLSEQGAVRPGRCCGLARAAGAAGSRGWGGCPRRPALAGAFAVALALASRRAARAGAGRCFVRPWVTAVTTLRVKETRLLLWVSRSLLALTSLPARAMAGTEEALGKLVGGLREKVREFRARYRSEPHPPARATSHSVTQSRAKRRLTRIRLALLSIAVRTIRQTSPYQVSGSGSLGSLARWFSRPGSGGSGVLCELPSSFAICSDFLWD
jgi:hypothetical protein